MGIYNFRGSLTVTYDHRLKGTGHPVRSAIHKLEIGRSVVGWVTTSESLLLYVFCFVLSRPLILFGKSLPDPADIPQSDSVPGNYYCKPEAHNPKLTYSSK